MFDEITVPGEDIIAEGVTKTLLQFRKSQLFLDVIAAFLNEVQFLVDTTQKTIKNRGPAEATGVKLDGLGNIVGQERSLIGYDAIAWFSPDTELQGADSVPVWVMNAPLTGDEVANDAWYRQLIEGKILRNFNNFSSTTEIKAFVLQMFGISISFKLVDTMTVQIYIPTSTPFNVSELIDSFILSNVAESVYFLPMAAGIKIGSVVHGFQLIPNGDFIKNVDADVTPTNWDVTIVGSPVYSAVFETTVTYWPPWANSGLAYKADLSSAAQSVELTSTDFIPVDVSKDYCLAMWQMLISGATSQYLGLRCYDADKVLIGDAWAIEAGAAPVAWAQDFGIFGGSGVAWPTGTKFVRIIARPMWESIGAALISRISFNVGTTPTDWHTTFNLI